MVQSFFSRLSWGVALLALQVLVFNHIHLFGYATPVVYVYILCLQSLDTSRSSWLLWGFFTGMVADLFSETPGVGAASMTLTAMCAPVLLRLMVPKDSAEDMSPDYSTLGYWKFVWYVVLVVLLQQAVSLMLEVFSFFNVLDLLYTYLGSSLLTIIFILVLAGMRGNRREKR